LLGVTVFFFAKPARLVSLEISKFDRLISIVVGTEKNSDRGNFPAKSKAEKFNGLAVGARALDEIFCAYKSARYDALRGSSGSDLRSFQTISLRARNRTISLT
jgi:hypothetical protein